MQIETLFFGPRRSITIDVRRAASTGSIDRSAVFEMGQTGVTAAMDRETDAPMDDGLGAAEQAETCQQSARVGMGGVVVDDVRLQRGDQTSKSQ